MTWRLRRRRNQLAAWSLAVATLTVFSCKKAEERPEARTAERPAEPVPPPPPADSRPRRTERIEILERLPSCEISHFGRLIDLGAEAVLPWTGFRPTAPARDDLSVRDGATYQSFRARDLEYQLWLNEPLEGLRLSVRGKGNVARRVQASFDGRRLGVAKLPEGQTRAFDFPELDAKIEPGLHRVNLRFIGGPRASQNSLAELDWIRIAAPADHRDTASYAAPTLLDLVANVALGGVPRRALVLRAPTTVRCFVRPRDGTKFRTELGLWGAGRAAAEIAVRREGTERQVLETRKIAGGDTSAWTPVEIDLGRFAGEPLALELTASEATRGARVAFGDTEIVEAKPDTTNLPSARVVVLVVLASTDRGRTPPWGPTANLGALASIARAGTAFSRYRAPSTVPAAALTTVLSGLLPRAHAVQAPLQRVPEGLRTIPRLFKESNGSSAFFTGAPTTFAPFGFGALFDTFEAFSPVKDVPASEPFARAAAWLTKELDERPLVRHFVVVHARGGHPPWDVSREEAAQLRPSEYNGAIDPRRGAIILGGLRARIGRPGRKLGEDDFTRLGALADASLAKQDAGLLQLLTVLKQKNVWDGALVIVMGDVGPGAPPELPYDPAGPLSEDRLTAPLVVKFPFGELAGKDLAEPVTAPDVAATLARALGVELPPGLPGVDLALRARGGGKVDIQAQHATLFGRYSTRQGTWLLRGELGQTPRLCALDVDPACAMDVFASRPVAARTAWLATLRGEALDLPRELGTAEPTPVELDPETRAALTVWGDLPP